ncbi:MAG: fluoride efflux transporter CrcB [Planctomycetota bacterium]
MVPFLWVALGGAAGAMARYGVALLLAGVRVAGFPWATLVVNVLGCAAIGHLLGIESPRPWLTDRHRWLLVSGFLGSFTTFSTFGHETYTLMHRGQTGLAGAYVASSLVLSGLALWIALRTAA